MPYQTYEEFLKAIGSAPESPAAEEAKPESATTDCSADGSAAQPAKTGRSAVVSPWTLQAAGWLIERSRKELLQAEANAPETIAFYYQMRQGVMHELVTELLRLGEGQDDRSRDDG